MIYLWRRSTIPERLGSFNTMQEAKNQAQNWKQNYPTDEVWIGDDEVSEINCVDQRVELRIRTGFRVPSGLTPMQIHDYIKSQLSYLASSYPGLCTNTVVLLGEKVRND